MTTPIRSAVTRRRVQLVCNDPSRTKQSMKAECDINNIMRKYQKTGAIDHFNRYSAVYGEAPAIEYREAVELVREADTMFKALPSSLRARFEHDPAEFLAFVQNPANRAEAASLGLTASPATPVAGTPPTTAPEPSKGA